MYVEIPHDPKFNIQNGDFTVEFWYFQRNENSENNTIIDKGNNCYLIQIKNNQLLFYTNTQNSSLIVNIPSFSCNKWIHLTVKKQENKSKVFFLCFSCFFTFCFRKCINCFSATA